MVSLRKLSVVLLVTLMFLALTMPTEALCTCKSKDVNGDPCSFKAKACGCLKGLKWKYKCDVSSKKTGSGESYSWTKSGEGCVKEALFRLFNKMSGPNECNCQQSALPFGACTLQSRVCFHFANTGTMEKAQPLFKAFVAGPDGEGSVASVATPEAAVQGAIQQLLTKFPQLVAQCDVPMLASGADIPLPEYSFNLPSMDMDGEQSSAPDTVIALE